MIHCSLCTIYVDNVLLKGHLFSAALPDMFGGTWVGVYYTGYKMPGDYWAEILFLVHNKILFCVPGVSRLFLGVLILHFLWRVGDDGLGGRAWSHFKYLGAF